MATLPAHFLIRIKGRIRCPYLAIPIPGERPFVVPRDRFERVTRGLNVTDASLHKHVTAEHGEIWALTVVHRTGRAHGRFVFYNVLQTTFQHTYWQFKNAMAAWADKQRNARVKPNESKFDKQARKLERELKKLYVGKPPLHPLLPSQYGWQAGNYWRDAELRWHERRAHRKRIARISGLVLKNHITGPTAYKMLRAMGYSVTRYCDVTASMREHYGVEFDTDFWKQLYRFCGIGSDDRSHLGYRRIDNDATVLKALEGHAERRVEYLSVKRQAQSLRDQISSIQQLAAFVPVAQPASGLIAA